MKNNIRPKYIFIYNLLIRSPNKSAGLLTKVDVKKKVLQKKTFY